MEMLRIVRKRAHISRAHIQQMIGIVCAIGGAPTQTVRVFNQRDFGSRSPTPRQMDGEQTSGEAAAENSDVHMQRKVN